MHEEKKEQYESEYSALQKLHHSMTSLAELMGINPDEVPSMTVQSFGRSVLTDFTSSEVQNVLNRRGQRCKKVYVYLISLSTININIFFLFCVRKKLLEQKVHLYASWIVIFVYKQEKQHFN